MSLKLLLSAGFITLCMNNPVQAQKIDTIRVKENQLVSSVLKPGKVEYAVFSTGPDGAIASLRIWTREISFSLWSGKKVIIIKGHSDGADTIGPVSSYSVCKADNFRPIYQINISKKLGISAYNFYDDRIVGADTVTNNTKKTFSMNSPAPSFNWDLDMEMVRTLPLADHKQFAICWYQPGSRFAPEYYLHTVIGSTTLQTPDNHSVECWMLKLTYSKDSYAIFFISKKTSELLKVDQFRNEKAIRHKVRLVTSAD